MGAVGTGEGANFVVQKGDGLPGQPDEQKKRKRGPTAEQIAAAKVSNFDRIEGLLFFREYRPHRPTFQLYL